jgi:hypothetical protein
VACEEELRCVAIDMISTLDKPRNPVVLNIVIIQWKYYPLPQVQEKKEKLHKLKMVQRVVGFNNQ